MRLQYLAAAVLLAINVAHAEEYMPLHTLYRWWIPSINDHMDTFDSTESPSGGISECQSWYIPSATATGRRTLYRLVSGNDHMESNVSGEGGYTTESTHGYPFDASASGLQAINRYYYSGTGDHLTAFSGEAPTGWSFDGNLGYGYPRFGCTPSGNIVTLTGTAVTLKADKVYGGAVTELTYGGKQFVNKHDAGRFIQTAFSFEYGANDNPTEAGDTQGRGSPYMSASVAGSTLSSSAKPLIWKGDINNGTGSTTTRA